MTTRFDIVQDSDIKNFKKQVQKKLNDGWQLHGSFKIFPDPSKKADSGILSMCYVQAVIREEKAENISLDKDSGSDPFDEF